MIRITREDCMRLMSRYGDKHFDLAVLDPPYGQIAGQENDANNGHFNLGKNGKGRFDKYFKPVEHVQHKRTDASTAYSWGVKYAKDKSCNWDVAPSQEYFDEVFRVSKAQVIWGGNYFTDKLPPSRNFITGDGGQGSGNRAHCAFKLRYRQPSTGNRQPIDMGCDLVGCEIDQKYYDKAMKRIAEYQAQSEMFSGAELRCNHKELFTEGNNEG